MTYKGSNWTRGELGNVPPSPSSIIVECNEPTCETTTTADKLPGDWHATNDPDEVILCASCKQRVPYKNRAPSEMRRENNATLTEWEAANQSTTDNERSAGGDGR